MTSYHRRQQQRERERRLARRRTKPTRNPKASISGMYAAVLLVLLILVLLFIRRYAQRVADAYVSATSTEEHQTIDTRQDTALTPSKVSGNTIGAARQHVRQAVDDAQGAAIRTLADEETP